MNPFLFIVGCERSGSKSVGRLLDAHPKIAVVNFPRCWIPSFYVRRLGLTPEGLVTPELVARLSEDRRFASSAIDSRDLEQLCSYKDPPPYSIFVSAIFDLYAQRLGKSLVADATSGYVGRGKTLHALWPWAKFVHLVRDGRDVCLSLMKANANSRARSSARGKYLPTGSEEEVSTIALAWKREVQLGRELGNLLGPDLYYELRYESVVADSERACMQLCGFLGVPYDRTMLRSQHVSDGAHPKYGHEKSNSPDGLGSRWRSKMSTEAVARFEAGAGDLLAELGYARGSGPVSRPVSTVKCTNPFVFIVGCPRSGTTLLRLIVDAHSQLAITRETHWIPEFFEQRIGLTHQGDVTPALVRKLLEDRRFLRFKISRSELLMLLKNKSSVSYASFISSMFDRYGAARAKPLVGNKTPSYVRSLPTLHALWPTAKFVHLIRDGRDVCLSLISWTKRKGGSGADRTFGRFSTWRLDPISTAALYWKWNVRLGQQEGSRLSPHLYHELRYERLVSEPTEACAALCAFLGVPYEDEMLEFHLGETRSGRPLDAKRVWQPITAGMRDWKSQMSAEDVERFEAAAGELLDELGYPRALPRTCSTVRRHVERISELFTQDLVSRGARVPADWPR